MKGIRAITYKLIELFENDNSTVFQLDIETKFGFTEIKKLKLLLKKIARKMINY